MSALGKDQKTDINSPEILCSKIGRQWCNLELPVTYTLWAFTEEDKLQSYN